ncbi:MAG: ABC transporter permease [Dehalococcoidia bacterium]|nr:ABC transporter permease [Dehalococcoidia bacterium]
MRQLLEQTARRTGGPRNLVFLSIMLALAVVGLLDLYLLDYVMPPSSYLYIFLITTAVLYGIYPLWSARRLTSYYWRRTSRHRLALVGLGFIAILIITAIVGPFFTQDPTLVDFKKKNLPPLGFTTQQSVFDMATGKFITREVSGTTAHPLGTDDKGRDMLAMLVSGARVSLQVGFLATLVAVLIGAVLGVASAYAGGWVDNVLMRFTDIMMTFPFFLLLVFIVFLFGPNLGFIILAIGLTGWTGVARLVRSETLSLRTRDFVVASRALGASSARIIFRHLIPNVISPIIVIATLSIPGVILAEAALSFIGLGDPSVTSWGIILNAGQNSLDTAWWVAVEPGILLFLTVLAFNFLGDGLRDAFDPRSQ